MAFDTKKFFKTYLPLSIILTLGGAIGLLVLVRSTVPTLAPRWFFFFLSVLLLTGPVLPFVYYLNQRFPSNPPVEGIVILRQALWVGVYGSTIAWLQLGRVLSFGLALILAGAFIFIEILLRMFEKSRWSPNR